MSRPAHACDLHASQPHAAQAENGDGIAEPYSGGLNRGNAIAQGLQACCFAVGNAVVDMGQSDLREGRVLRETARKLKTNDRAPATEVASLGPAQGAIAAWQLGPRRHSIAWAKPGNSWTGLNNTGAKFVAEELHRSFGL